MTISIKHTSNYDVIKWFMNCGCVHDPTCISYTLLDVEVDYAIRHLMRKVDKLSSQKSNPLAKTKTPSSNTLSLNFNTKLKHVIVYFWNECGHDSFYMDTTRTIQDIVFHYFFKFLESSFLTIVLKTRHDSARISRN